MKAWKQAKAVEEIKDTIKNHPLADASAQQKNSAANLEILTFPRGRPLVRFIARMFDLSLFTLIFITFVSIFSPELILHTSKIILFVINLLLWVLIEPMILSIFGNTVGKALMNTKIKSQNGDSIHFHTAFKRSFLVILAGMGLGVPLINFICNLFSLFDLRKNGMSTWDRKSGTIVLYGKVNMPRILFASLIPAILFISGIAI